MMSTGVSEIAAFLAYKFFSAAFTLLPRPFCLAAGGTVGRVAFHLDKRHRAIALSNLKLALGKERTPDELGRLAEASFARIGRTAADILKISHYPLKKIQDLVSIEGRDHLEKAREGKRGVLLFTAHFGNWEMGTAAVSGIAPFRVIARDLDNPLLEKELERLRAKLGAGVISKFGAARPVLRALARNEIVATLIDQNVLRSEAVFVDFFGIRAATTPSLATFHLRTGAPLLPVFVHSRPGGKYVLRILEPVRVSSGDGPEADVLKITRVCTKIIEQEIRGRPDHWLWIHKRWNTRPADEYTSS
jgi:KDO2-lipid IV(A) lauroyltransferase